MKQLILMRHGDAESIGPSGDKSRKLTEFGRRQVQSTVSQLTKHCRPTTLIHSPYARAIETADIVLGALPQECERFSEQNITPGERIEDFIRVLSGYEYTDSLMVVTHNPVVSYVAATLVPELSSSAFRTAQAVVFAVGDFPHTVHVEHIILPQ